MTILIIYDSAYGNTKRLAEAMAAAINAKAVPIADADMALVQGADFLVVGSPINGWRPTPRTTTFLSRLPRGSLAGKRAAAFDTRVKLFIHGDAAKKIGKLLSGAGATVLAAEGFIVKGTEGPLADGEVERGIAWIRRLVDGAVLR